VGYYAIALSEMKQPEAVVRVAADLMPQRLPTLLPSEPEHSQSANAPAAFTARGFLSSWIDPPLLRLTREVLLQNLQKLCLQEGEKLVLVSLTPAAASSSASTSVSAALDAPTGAAPDEAAGKTDASISSSSATAHAHHLAAQGVYGLVQNLGSLVARMLLQPLEEAAFMEFSLAFAGVTRRREMASATRAAEIANVSATQGHDVAVADAESAAAPDNDAMAYSSGAVHLGVLLHLVLLVGLLLLCFGPGYSYVLLDLLYGARWSAPATGASELLSLYCAYICLLALNGVAEGFVAATITSRQLRAYNAWLLACSVVYLSACAGLMPVAGTTGLLAANALNMLMRIAYSARFIHAFFAQGPAAAVAEPSNLARLRALAMPSTVTLCSFFLSLLVTQTSLRLLSISGSHSLPRFAAHVAVGVLCLIAVAASVWKCEKPFLQQLKDVLAKRKHKRA